EPTAIFHTDLGKFYLDRKRWNDALDAFVAASAEDPAFFGNYWGIGEALIGLRRFDEAREALHTALKKEPQLESPASDRIAKLLDQCAAREPVDETSIPETVPDGEAPIGSEHTARVIGKNPSFVFFEVVFVTGRCHRPQ